MYSGGLWGYFAVGGSRIDHFFPKIPPNITLLIVKRANRGPTESASQTDLTSLRVALVTAGHCRLQRKIAASSRAAVSVRCIDMAFYCVVFACSQAPLMGKIANNSRPMAKSPMKTAWIHGGALRVPPCIEGEVLRWGANDLRCFP